MYIDRSEQKEEPIETVSHWHFHIVYPLLLILQLILTEAETDGDDETVNFNQQFIKDAWRPLYKTVTKLFTPPIIKDFISLWLFYDRVIEKVQWYLHNIKQTPHICIIYQKSK